MSDTPDLASLPMPAKVGGAAVGGAGFLGVAYMLRDNIPALIILVFGIILVIAVLVMWVKLMNAQGGKAKVFGEGLGAELRRTPQQVTDPDKRAKLDDLRRKLNEGVTKLQATGKNLYILPWYLMVGEPGSGKTKALAAASIALPGFQDPLQGSGGTVNMNWWFTNSGIILDTAGRLMLPEVATGSNPEWEEFLVTLNRRRPNCPINGLMLAIPADTLITDSADKIDKKAGDIAFQFNKVQTTLGIRFPVFVLITKCDKILGFREFFETVNQPDEQAQMMGWSNPQKLDDPFRPEQVDQHLLKVQEQLVKRRMGMLSVTEHTEDPTARRLDQVDALYELPDSLVALGPRLRRYLEAIFVAGPLSSKPLFLRGIYFTSSLQTGEALDKAISTIMGVDIAAAHGEPVVSEKPYFLRHVFQEKVFKEKGLVTRTSNVAKLKRGRKTALLVAGLTAAALIGGFLWLGQSQLEHSVGEPAKLWSGISDRDPKRLAIIDTDNKDKYQGRDQVLDKYTLLALNKKAQEDVAKPIVVPLIFKPMTWLDSNFDERRREAYKDTFESSVLAPLADRAARKMKDDRTAWQPGESSAALEQLIGLQAKSTVDQVSAGESTPISAFGRYVMSDADRATFNEDREAWDADFKWLYTPRPAGGGATWPPAALITARNDEAIQHGSDAFLAYEGKRAAAESEPRLAASHIGDLLKSLDDAEQDLIKIARGQLDTLANARPAMDEWSTKWSAYSRIKDELDKALSRLRAAGWKPAPDASLAAFYQDAVHKVDDHQIQDISEILHAIPASPQDPTLKDVQSRLASRLDLVQKDELAANGDAAYTSLRDREPVLLAFIGTTQQRIYEQHYEMLALADQELSSDNGPATRPAAANDFLAEVTRLDRRVEVSMKRLADWERSATKGTNDQKLARLAQDMTDLGARRHRFTLLETAIKDKPSALDGWGTLVRSNISQAPAAMVPAIALPFTGIDGHHPFPTAEYDPQRFGPIQAAWSAVENYIQPPAAVSAVPGVPATTDPVHPIMDLDTLQREFKPRDDAWRGFRDLYVTYWRQDVPALMAIKPATWTDFRTGLNALDFVTRANLALHTLGVVRSDALKTVGDPASSQVAVEPAKMPEFVQRCAIVRQNWISLDPSPPNGRITLLNTRLSDFIGRYLMRPANPTVTGHEAYWDQLYKMGFQALGAAVDQSALDALALLNRDYHKFPIGPKVDPANAADPVDKNDLTVKELAEARVLIERIFGPPHAPEPAGADSVLADATLPPDLIVDLSKPLEQLKGSSPDASAAAIADRKRLKTLRPILDALGDDTLKGQFTLLKTHDKEDVRGRWFYIGLWQGTTWVGKKPYPLDNNDSDAIPFRHEPHTIEFRMTDHTEGSENPANYTARVPIGVGPWSSIRTVLDGPDRAVTLAKDGLGFAVKYTFKDGATERALTVKVEFTDLGANVREMLPYWNGKP